MLKMERGEGREIHLEFVVVDDEAPWAEVESL
jgi:hypothetical protein